jgi:hypothetical protein
MDLLPPEPPGYWKFKLVASGAFWAAVGGGVFALDSDPTTASGIARAAAGAAVVVLSIGGFLYYWRSL